MKITDAIAQTNPWSVYSKCLNEDGSNPNYEFNDSCELITRDADGYRATVNTPYLNLGGIETAGVDVQFNWSFPAGPGRVSVNAVVNFLDYYRDQVSPTDPFIDSTGTFRSGGQYDYRTFTTLTYAADRWSLGLRNRFLPNIKSADAANNPDTTVQGAGGYSMMDLFGSYTLSERLSLRGGVDNLFDRDPAVVGRNPGTNNAVGSTNAAYYDALGRRYFMSVQLDL